MSLNRWMQGQWCLQIAFIGSLYFHFLLWGIMILTLWVETFWRLLYFMLSSFFLYAKIYCFLTLLFAYIMWHWPVNRFELGAHGEPVDMIFCEQNEVKHLLDFKGVSHNSFYIGIWDLVRFWVHMIARILEFTFNGHFKVMIPEAMYVFYQNIFVCDMLVILHIWYLVNLKSIYYVLIGDIKISSVVNIMVGFT